MPTHKGDLTILTLTQLSELVGRKPHTVRRRLDGLPPVRTNGRTRYYNSAAALELIYLTETADLSRERARLAKAQSFAQELKNQETEGRLLDRDEVIETSSARIVAAKSKLRAIPKKLRTRIPGFTVAMARMVLEQIDEALTELARDGLPARRNARRRRSQ